MNKRKVSVFEYYQEKMIEFTDFDYNSISNDRARHILGKFFRLPDWLQIRTINEMVEHGLLRRNGKRQIEIKSSS